MALSEEPIFSRLERLDNMVRRLEEIRGCGRSPKSSCASTPSSGSGTLTGESHTISSVDFSPKSIMEKHCRPINHVIKVTEVKGSILERIDHIEDRVLKLCQQLEVEMEKERVKNQKMEEKKRKKGLKQLIQQCMVGGGKQRESWS